MDGSEEDADLLNEETFDCAEIGDWECEHELFVQNLQEESEKPPAADELPEFWKDSDSFSFLWSSDNLNCNLTTSDDTGERVVDVEETLKKLVLDETFEDPAILDISRKVSCQKLNDESFQHLRNAPAYPTVPTNIINGTRDIWSIDSCGESGRTNENVNLASGCSAKPKSIVDVIRSLTACASVVNGNKLVSIESHTKNNSVYRSNTESQTRQANSTSCPKSHPPVGLHNITSSVGQNEVDLISLLRIGNHAVQSQTNQNHPSVHNNIHQTHLPANSASMEILKGHLPTDANVLLRLSALTNMHSSLRDYSQIHNSLLIQNQHIIRQNLPPTFPVTSNQCSVFISPGVSGLLGSNIQPNILPYLPRFPTHPVNVNFKPHVCQASPIVTSPKMSAGSVGSTEEINPVKQIDPNRGSWMTDYESIGVLLIQLRPLIVSNPYVQDYYFASRWLRRMNEVRAKHIANGQRTTAPLATSMQIPIPIPLESLNDSQSPIKYL
ncbi:unnamed protein product [Heterobilharzia americana]|nr:unnamed protein product [Heterobilharzia americana]